MDLQLLHLSFAKGKHVGMFFGGKYKTTDMHGADIVFLYVGDHAIDNKEYMWGFVSSAKTIGNPTLLKKNLPKLAAMDTQARVEWIKSFFQIEDMKIPKDKINNRLVGDNGNPVSVYGKTELGWNNA